MPTPVKSLFEAHLPVMQLERSVTFYKKRLGLEEAYTEPTRRVTFFWLGKGKHSMLGLWEVGSAPISIVQHVAFEVSVEECVADRKSVV